MIRLLMRLWRRIWCGPEPPFLAAQRKVKEGVYMGYSIGNPSAPLRSPRARLTGLSHWKYRDRRLTLVCDDCDRAIANLSTVFLQHLCTKGAQQAMHN